MRVISARDVLKGLPQYKYKNEFDVINRDNDDEVHAVLAAVGFDVKRGVGYDVALHRDMQGTVGVGYMLSAEYSLDPKFRKFHDMTDRKVIAYTVDPSLGRELDEISGKRFEYRNDEELEHKVKTPKDDPRYYSEQELQEMGYTGGDEEEEYDGAVSEDYDSVSQQINTLKQVLIAARGAE